MRPVASFRECVFPHMHNHNFGVGFGTMGFHTGQCHPVSATEMSCSSVLMGMHG